MNSLFANRSCHARALVVAAFLLVCRTSIGVALELPRMDDSTRVEVTEKVIDTTAASAPVAVGDTTRPGFFKRIQYDLITQVTSPFNVDGSDLLWIGAGGAAFTSLLLADESIEVAMRGTTDRNPWMGKVSPVVGELGGTAGAAGTILFMGYSVLLGDDRDLETSAMLGEAYFTSAIWARVGKFVAGRERPSVAMTHPHPRGGRWSGPIEPIVNPKGLSNASFESFPSGHTATAFALATVFAKRYDDDLVVPVVAYSAATLVGLSRVVEHQHWASDVFAGALLGYLCASQIVTRGEVLERAREEQSSLFKPFDYRFYASFSDGPVLGMSITF